MLYIMIGTLTGLALWNMYWMRKLCHSNVEWGLSYSVPDFN